jgi:hypothetical protein
MCADALTITFGTIVVPFGVAVSNSPYAPANGRQF